MTARTVKTQAELDAALADKVDWIDIKSEAGVWLYLSSTGSATVRASDSATVTAYGSATVRASDSATVRASGSATVTAYDSATVRASGSATVTAYDSATVTAYGSATVTAYGSATVRASDSATVTAYGSATVRASDSATVTAYGSATVRAGSHTAVHLHSASVNLTGGVVIDHTKDLSSAEAWCEYHGVTVEDGIATLYKAVDAAWRSPHGASYEPGSTPSAPDWRDDDECGHGLHFGPTPSHAQDYFWEATKFLEVGIALTDLRPLIGGTAKCKAPKVTRPCVEVDVHGRQVQA